MGRGIGGIAELQLVRRARDHLDHAVGDVLLHAEQPQRRAALPGGAERRHDDVVGDLLRQRGGVDDHRIDAAGLRDQRHNRLVLAGEHAVDGARHLGRAGERDAGAAPVGDERGADLAVADHELQRLGGNAGLVQDTHRGGGDAWRLLGGLGGDRIAGGERGRDLADENRQRKIPRADADEHATTTISELVRLSRSGPAASAVPSARRASSA